MPDKVSINFRVNKIHMPNVKSAESALLTIERAQKLDLLIHLITNLRQSLVICGANGIGKTTLLEELKKCEKDGLPVLSLSASSNLSFESFQSQLLKLLGNEFDCHDENKDISAVLPLFEKKNHKIVIIIDDAGQLVPGLISTLIQYASENKCLRIVFSLTQDEIQLKNSSDRGIEDCHFIEIPPLTQKQCGVFLQNLSAQPRVTLSFNDVTDPLIEHVYRETHGIPGEIISKVSKGIKGTAISWENYQWIGLVLVAAIAVTLGGFFIFDGADSEDNREKNNPYQIAPEPENTVIIDSYVQSNEYDVSQSKVDVDSFEEKQEKEDFSQQKGTEDIQVTEKIENGVANVAKKIIPTEITEPLAKVSTVVEDINKKHQGLGVSSTKLVKKPKRKIETKAEDIQVKEVFSQQNEQEKNTSIQSDIKKTKIIETVRERDNSLEQKNILEKIIKQPNKEKIKAAEAKNKNKISKKKEKSRKENVDAKKDDSKWILKQPADYYTMQLIVLSKREAVTGFLKEYPKLLDDLKFFQKIKQSGSHFVVIYGAFKDAATASKKMKSLPPRYRKAWIRSFSGLHKMIKK